MRSRAPIVLLAAAAIALAGCGGGGANTQAGGGGQGVQGLTLPKESSDLNVKPVIPKPKGAPPTALQSRDVVQGNGATAESGDKLSVEYIGVSWSTGKQFDSSWDPGKPPIDFTLGGGDVIPGWDQGLVGMRVGGRRELVIPPSLAYGSRGAAPAIGPNETLVFVVDLKKVAKSG
jgi:peptidylprolyl isomerase